MREHFDSDADSASPDLDTGLIRRETVRTVAQALGEIDARCRQLLRLLAVEPALSYEDIAATLRMPVGSIGPTRARCLEKLARRPAIARIRGRTAPSELTGDET